MIQSLRFEPQGQRQRLEPQGSQSHESERHIHLHFHLDLTFRANQRRSTPPKLHQVISIFATLVTTTLIIFSLFFPISATLPSSFISNIGWFIIVGGLALAWFATFVGGLPLLIETWRANVRARFLLVVPFIPLLGIVALHFLQPFGLMPWSEVGPILARFLEIPTHFFNSIGFFFLLLYSYAFISTFVLSTAIRRVTITDAALRFAHKAIFVVVGAMALIVSGVFLLSFNLLFVAPTAVRFFLLPILLMAIIIAIRTLFSQPHHTGDTRPKNDSTFDSY